MDFPSRIANRAARPLLRPRGVGAKLLRSSTLRPLARRLRSRRSASGAAWPGPPGDEGEPVPVLFSHAEITRGGLVVEEVGDGSSHVLALSGELDSDSVPMLEAAISRCCADGPTSITLDLSELSFIDSSGLWTITVARKWCESHGHAFWLIPGPEPVQYVFEATGLSDVLPFKQPGWSAT
jgi:anti-sigma B factor antagonist